MTQPFTSTPTGNLKEDVNFQELSQGTIRSEGREGQHIEGGLVLNEDGADVDFRVESDTEPNALFVDGATGRVGVGTASPGPKFEVVDAGAVAVGLRSTGTGQQVIFQFKDATKEWRITKVGNDFWFIDQTAGAIPLKLFSAAPTDSLRVETAAVVVRGLRVVGRTATATDPTTTELPADKDFGLHKNTSSGAVFLAYNDGGAIKKVALT